MKPGTISSDRKKRNFAVRILNFCKLVIEILKFSSKKTSRYSILRYYQACCTGMNQRTCGVMIVTIRMKKAFRNTQTLRARCSKAQPKKNRPAADPLPVGAERSKFNQLEMVTTFTYTQFGEDQCTQFRVIVVTVPQTPTNTRRPPPTDRTDNNTLRR